MIQLDIGCLVSFFNRDLIVTNGDSDVLVTASAVDQSSKFTVDKLCVSSLQSEVCINYSSEAEDSCASTLLNVEAFSDGLELFDILCFKGRQLDVEIVMNL